MPSRHLMEPLMRAGITKRRKTASETSTSRFVVEQRQLHLGTGRWRHDSSWWVCDRKWPLSAGHELLLPSLSVLRPLPARLTRRVIDVPRPEAARRDVM